MSTNKLTRSALLIALGIVFPYIVHMTGIGGSILLPMHFSPLLGGFLVGPYFALIVGAILPPLNFAISGMPPMPIMAFMTVELAVFGFIAGRMYRRFNVIISLITAMLAGRIVYALLFAFLIEFQNPIFIIAGGLTTGLPGIVLQLILIPVIVKALLKKGGSLNLEK